MSLLLYSTLAHGGCFKVQLVQYDSYINTTASQMSMCRKYLEANKHLFNTCIDSVLSDTRCSLLKVELSIIIPLRH